jgi:hypothetical protein
MSKMRTQFVTLLALGLGAADVASAQARVNTGEAARTLPLPTQAEVDKAADAIRLPKDLKVPAEWVPYLNRAYEEYWTEGTHRPDAGFVLFARNPTKETAKLWLLRMESKAQNLEQLFALVKDAQIDLVRSGLMADRFNMVSPAKAATLPAPKEAPKLAAATDLSSLEFFFIFSPSCPHCARMAETLVGFPNVRPLQATEGPVKDWPGLPPSDLATPETLSTYVAGGGVPVLVVFDRKSNRLLKMTGAKSSSEILGAASTVLASAALPANSNGKAAGGGK